MNRQSVPNAVLGYPGKPPNGGSNPRFYDFDDGVTRLVKWHPSIHGAKACYNELVASRLGQLLGAPIIRGVIVHVPDDIIPPDHRQDRAVAGFHFAVARMEGENFVPALHYSEIENHSELPFAAVFLAWLAVGDQEGHNQFLQRLEVRAGSSVSKPTKRFKLIDMGQMFGRFDWSANAGASVHDRYVLPRHLAAKVTVQTLSLAATELAKIDERAICDCFDDSPDEWGVPEADKQAAITRVLGTQVSKVMQIIQTGNASIQ